MSVLIGTHQPIGTIQTRRVSVPIDSQVIGTVQIKRVRLRHGSHTIYGNEVISKWCGEAERSTLRCTGHRYEPGLAPGLRRQTARQVGA